MLVLFVSLMHILWGCMLLLNQGPLDISAAWAFRELVGHGHWQLRAACYIVAGLLPAVLLKWPGSIIGLISCLPQQLLLILSGISAMVAIANGHFADGVIRPSSFIAMDQGIYAIAAMLYSMEALDRFKERGGNE